VNDPVLVDTTLHRAFTITYAIYVLTGFVAVFALPPSLEAVGGRELTAFWILGMAVTSVFSLVFSLRERWQRREMISTTALFGFLLIYALAVLINAFADWNIDRLLVGVFSMSYSVFPGWQVQFLFRKFRKPRG
jgi:hypothetical protein